MTPNAEQDALPISDEITSIFDEPYVAEGGLADARQNYDDAAQTLLHAQTEVSSVNKRIDALIERRKLSVKAFFYPAGAQRA